MSGDPARSPGFLVCVMTGSSMTPTIFPDDKVIVELAPLRRLRPGELLLLDRGEKLKVVHRLLRVETNGGVLRLFTKGDANVIWDAPLALTQVAGRVAMIGRPPNGWLRIDGRRGRAANAIAAAGYRAAALLCPPERGLEGFLRAAASLRWAEEPVLLATVRGGWRAARPLRRLVLRWRLRRLDPKVRPPAPARALNEAISALWRRLAGA